METKRRQSVPISPELSALTTAIRDAKSPQRQALEAMVGPLPAGLSEAAALGALLELAKAVVFEASLAAEYQAYALARDKEDAQFERAIRARRARREN
ncbi:MAG: hypothetical protein FWG25_03535 [Promicromonosporaceae bacterium]|nr:hypothetical protein [Promicromonosporaceae bacterium]